MPVILVDTDLNNAFGQVNIDSWADLDGDEEASHISSRRIWAMNKAEGELLGKLENTKYDMSGVTSANASVELKEYLAKEAGLALYFSRGQVGTESINSTNKRNTFAVIREKQRKILFKLQSGQNNLRIPLNSDYEHDAPMVIVE